MNFCDAKQKAFAQRVYFDLKICRKWSKLHVYFDQMNQWIFFLGKPSEDQPLTFVLPISSDEQFTIDDLFNMKSKLTSALKFNIEEEISNVLMAIIANDFTLGYFNLSSGLPQRIPSDMPPAEPPPILSEFSNEMKKEIIDHEDEWMTSATWD